MTRSNSIATTGQRNAISTPRVGARIARLWHSYWRRRAQLATLHLLHSLDDRTLHDIGIGRCEISSVVYGRRGERMHCYDKAWRSWHAGL